jgi:pimeloyl-ACP methyl ester carboxylesterase
MRKLYFVNLFILCYSFSHSQNIDGNWRGNINVNGNQIPLIFHFYKDSLGNINVKWDSPDQNANNLPCTDITVYGDSIKIGLKIISGYYNGKLITADSISGMWHQGNGSVPLNFKKFTDTVESDKKISYPNEKEISITSAGGSKLFGTLLSKNNNQKLAIIIAGSGPTDRNGNNPMGVKAATYEMLAHALDSQNIATFRFDKRGLGKSMVDDFDESKMIFDDYINDAGKIFDYLHDTLGFKDIYFIGHSEGSLIGMVASQKKKVKGFVSIAGAGRPIDEVIEEQVKSQPLPDSLKTKITLVFNELKKGKEVNNVPAPLNPIFRNSIQPYMISWLKYSPAREIKKLNCPVLILQGTCDKQIKIEDAEDLHNANKKSTLDIIPLMTHTLKNTDAGCKDENNKTYMNPSLPINKKLAGDIVDFIKK